MMSTRSDPVMTPLQFLSARWPEIDALLDQALALPPAQWPGWLDALTGESAALRETLVDAVAAAPADLQLHLDGVHEFDSSGVQRTDHRTKLGDDRLAAYRSCITRLRGEESEGVIAPVVDETGMY